RVPAPEHTRPKRIALTGRGSAAVKTMLDAVRAVERDWRRELGANEFEQLRAILLDLNDRLLGHPRESGADEGTAAASAGARGRTRCDAGGRVRRFGTPPEELDHVPG